jgi:hypothetical protein
MYLRLGRRHARLCRKTPGAEKFAETIQPKLDRLAEKENEKKHILIGREDAYDDVVLCDSLLDDAVRTVFEHVRQYDREHLTRLTDVLFPKQGYSEIVYKSLQEEPQAVSSLIVKLEGVEAGDELKQYVPLLREKVQASTGAWDAYEQVNAQYRQIQAEEELLKLDVQRQYEINWLDARKLYGQARANNLFPKISAKPVSESDAEEAQNGEGG